MTIPWDAKAHFYPQLQFLAQSFHRGEAPFWTPFVFSGAPQVADPQSLIFSPPFLLAAWLSPSPGFRLADGVVLVTLGVGGAALIALFRDRGWHPAGALVAAVTFAFGASAAWRIQHLGQVVSLSFLAIAVWLLLRALERQSAALGFAAGIVAGFMALGRDQVAYLGLWVLAGVTLWHLLTGGSALRALRDGAKPLALGLLGGALVVTVPAALTILLSGVSNRPSIDLAGAGQGSLHPALLLTALIPNLFGVDGPFADYWGPPSPRWGEVDLFLARNMGVLYLGALPLALLVVAAARGVLWQREIRPFTILAILMLLYALGRYTPFFAAVFRLAPGVDLFRRPADATFALGGLLSILAGYAAHRWWTSTLPLVGRRRRLIEDFVLAAPFAIGIVLAIAKGTLGLATEALLKAALCLMVSLAAIRFLPRLALRTRAGAIAALLALLTADLAWNNGPNESTALPPQTYDALDPRSRDPLLQLLKARLAETASETRLDRVELTGLGFHWPNASLVHRFHNVLGYNPLRLGLYSAATGAGDHAALSDQRRFSALFPSYRSTLADLLGLRFIATGVPVETIDAALKPGDLSLIGSFKEGFVYENPRTLPRVLFATRAQGADFDVMLKEGRWPDIDLTSTVLLTPEAAARSSGFSSLPEPSRASAPAVARDPFSSSAPTLRIAAYRTTEVTIETEAAQPGYVVLSDPFHPWWFAEVDGREAEILQANVLFRAVAVPAGRHIVRFTFRPLAGAWKELRGHMMKPSSGEPSGERAAP